ncbi:MAG: polyprenyl synthetase family protein [Chitinophagaceae bacterium]
MKLAKAILKNELVLFEKTFQESLKNHNPLLTKIIQSLPYREGKLLRPILTLLSARLSGNIQPKVYQIACMIEFFYLHTEVQKAIRNQVLIEDSKYTANALWNNQIALLAGNFMLAKSFLLSVTQKEYKVLELISQAMQQQSDSLLQEARNERIQEMSEPIYYDIIKRKVASLFAVACASGAYSVRYEENTLKLFFDLGENLGMAFQIKNDISYYSNSLVLGKKNSINLSSYKNTLPMLYAIEHVNNKEKNFLIDTFEKQYCTEKELWEAIDIITHSGSIDYASKIMLQYREKVFSILYKLPESLERLAMEELVYFIIEKKA